MSYNIRIIVACLVAAPMFGGCAGMMKNMMAKMDPSSGDKTLVNDAIKANKWDDVEKYCDRKFKKVDGKKLHYKAKRIACDSSKKHKIEASDKEWKEATCKNIIKVWEKNKRTFTSQRRRLKGLHNEASVRMGKCGHYAYVFKELIHWGPLTQGALGIKSLQAMDKAGLPIEKEYLKWFGKHSASPYTPKLGMYALGHYIFWREMKGGNIDCNPYVKVWKVLEGGEDVAWAYSFYRFTKCKAAADWVAKGLAHSYPKARHRACKTLGIVGNKSHTKKMGILAKSDGTYKIVRRTKVYWVRDQCRAAVGQINMR